MTWQSGASLDTLRARAQLLESIRAFFRQRDILEVSTPLLCEAGVTDPAIEPLTCADGDHQRYLQTSPEYAMKRLLVADIGPIYQICPAFRAGEAGARHNPEFTMLEWYRPGFDEHALMAEVGKLLAVCLGRRDIATVTYRQAFLEALDIDPHTATTAELEQCARRNFETSFAEASRDMWLDLLISHAVEPYLSTKGLCFVHDYPASQAALACLGEVDGVTIARRFELYVDGLELANGYFELTDAEALAARFEADNLVRVRHGQTPRPVDERLLAAMQAGLPSCAGVALGVDRLLMVREGIRDIRQALTFDWHRC